MFRKKNYKSISIIGVECSFPGARNVAEYWKNILAGITATTSLDEVERNFLSQCHSNDRTDNNKSICNYTGYNHEYDEAFDNDFFNISPKEAKSLDPQQKLLLKKTWQCIESSCINPSKLRDYKTGVYVGVMSVDNLHEEVSQYQLQDSEITSYSYLNNCEATIANRISSYFGFTGESISINAACASSLMALKAASSALNEYEIDFAIVAGVNYISSSFRNISFSKAGMISSGHACKTFDAAADGYVPGEGVGVLLLTRHNLAEQYNCYQWATINAVVANHNGRNLTITAPKLRAQSELLNKALRRANISSVDYIEMHGTGTSIGDPIEIAALCDSYNTAKNLTYVGSVKSNIGHLEAASGIAGIIKCLCMFRNQIIPKQINVETLNPLLENSGVIIANNAKQYKLKYCAISSFGFGGVNAHCILEFKNNKCKNSKNKKKIKLPILISSENSASLEALIDNTLSYLSKSEIHSANSLYSLIFGRNHLSRRAGQWVYLENDKVLCDESILAMDDSKCITHYLSDYTNINIHRNSVEKLVSKNDKKLWYDIGVFFKDNFLLPLHVELKGIAVYWLLPYLGFSKFRHLDKKELSKWAKYGIRLNFRVQINNHSFDCYKISRRYVDIFCEIPDMASDVYEYLTEAKNKLINRQYTFTDLYSHWEYIWNNQKPLLNEHQNMSHFQIAENYYFALAKSSCLLKIYDKWDMVKNSNELLTMLPEESKELLILYAQGVVNEKDIAGLILCSHKKRQIFKRIHNIIQSNTLMKHIGQSC